MIKLQQIISDINLHEGLEITYPLSTAVSALEDWGTWDNKRNVKYDIYDNKVILVAIIKITTLEFDHLLKIANSMGYYPSSIVSQIKGGKYDNKEAVNLIENNIPFYLKLEAKYDIELNRSKLPKFLYHATDEVYKDKIMKIGLVPKSKEKLVSHPSRIYFTFKKEDALLFSGNPNSKIKNVVIFEVDVSESYKVIRLFEDPHSNGRGVYTYQNIPSNCLKIVE